MANDRFAVADIFTDHMVLQRNANVKVWGEERTVRWLKFVLKDKTGRWVVAKGKWMVELKTGEAGGPYKLEIVNGNHKICLRMFS